jgi:transketolase
MQAILDAVSTAKAVTYKPTVIIAHTIPGKGVRFMEYDHRWHGKAPDSAQAEVALAGLTVAGSRAEQGAHA